VSPIHVFIPGIPKPGGSKTASLIRRKGGAIVTKNGRPLITMRDDAKGNPDWKATVAYFARAKYDGSPLTCPLTVKFSFVMPRLKCHYGSGRNEGRLKDSAAICPTVKPDVTKLVRAAEDALTGILWRDDNLIVHQIASKVYGDQPGLDLTVWPADLELIRDGLDAGSAVQIEMNRAAKNEVTQGAI
jgi:Holliday junction resolvase RusA-like endonuclease